MIFFHSLCPGRAHAFKDERSGGKLGRGCNLRWCASVGSTRLPPRTVPTPHPVMSSPCNPGLPFAGWLLQPSPASLFLTLQLAPQGLDLSRGRKQLSRCLDSAHIALAVHKSLSGQCPFLPPLHPLCHNTSTTVTLLPIHPPPGELLQAEAVATLLGIPRNQARYIISSQ